MTSYIVIYKRGSELSQNQSMSLLYITNNSIPCFAITFALIYVCMCVLCYHEISWLFQPSKTWIPVYDTGT